MVFRPVRWVILLGAAFVAGLVYERSEARTRCLDMGGVMDGALCIGAK